MAFQIEILAIKEDLYPIIKEAIRPLNKVQDEFRYEIPNDRWRGNLFLKRRESYYADDAFQWLRDYRQQAKGHRPFMILVIDGFLSSNKWANLFGVFSSKDNCAVVTMHDVDHFIQDTVRFCRYFFVRYSLNFVQPLLKSHSSEVRKDCMLHFKQNKMEIKLSLDSGHICDQCLDILRPALTDDIYYGIKQMLQVVSNQHPYALVIKGGGVKGLAFAGALLELEKHFSFDTFAGTSAGAIAAVLLGAGYKPKELLTVLNAKDFKDFKDASLFEACINLIFKQGLFKGNAIRLWISQLLKQKFPEKLREIALAELPNHTIIYSARTQDGTLTFDSKGERRDAHASFAARCSMSIPVFFTPMLVDNIKVYDGGTRNNFPFKVFSEAYSNKLVIGLYLVSGTKNNGNVLADIANIAIDGEELAIVEKNLDKVVVIDPRPIRTTDFNLSLEKKELLVLAGRLAALKFIKRNHRDVIVDGDEIENITQRIQSLRKLL